MAIVTNTVRLTAQIAEFQSEFQKAARSTQQFQQEFEGIATRAAAVGTFIGSIAADIAGSLARAFGQGLRDAIRLSSEFNNSFIGLSSVARAFGTDAGSATEAAKRLSSDGLLPLKDSATGLKNLLAAGFNLDQATQLMNAFKDSAAFGRQSALSFGDAVRSATEGVKNGNSILVDNAGVTKNLSQILKEAGFSAQDLSRASSDAGVRMALFNGILRETAAQTGDAQRLTETYSGQVARLESAYSNLLATLGDAVTQNATVAKAIGFVGDEIFRLNGNLGHNQRAFVLVSDAVIVFVRALSSIIHVVDLVQTGFAGLQVFSNGVFEALSRTAAAVFQLVERVERLQVFLNPINFKQHAAAADEARRAYEFLSGAAQGLADHSNEVNQRQIRWGNTLQGLRGKLDDLAVELEKTRGQTVELGKAGSASGTALGTGLAGGAKKAGEAAKELRAGLKAVVDDIKFVEQKIEDIGVAFERDLGETMRMVADDIKFVEQRITDSAEAMDREITEAMKSIRDEIASVEQRIQEIEPLPPGFWEEFMGVEDINLGKEARRAADGIIGSLADAIRTGNWGEFKDNLQRNVAEFMGSAIAAGVNTLVPGLGTLLQPIFSALSNAFINLFDRNKGRDAIESWVEDTFGSFRNLQDRLLELGKSDYDRLWKQINDVGRNNVGQARAAIAAVTAALDEFGTEAERAQRRMTALGQAVDGVNRKAQLFISPFQKLLDASKAPGASSADIGAKFAEMAQRGQAEFERLGTFVAATFAGIVKETGDAIGAIGRLKPAFQALQDGVNQFGLSSTGTINALIGLFDLVNDAVTGPIVEGIQATGQIFTGLRDAGILTRDLFQTVATDIGASFRELEAKGGDVAKAMALSQPILQALWEGQQIYGEITDETTRKLLEQAHEQGLVGAHMRDVNQKILDVLIAIADVFGADIPEGLRRTEEAARNTARGIEDEFKNIKISPIEVPVNFNFDELPTRPITPLARGGIVRQPTLALIGEAGPEAVVPLDGKDSIRNFSMPESIAGGDTYITIPGAEFRRALETGSDVVVKGIVGNRNGAKTSLFGRGAPVGAF